MFSEPKSLLSEYNQGLEKKQRNLAKRKTKLDQYKANLAKGTALNDDQKKAIAKYDEVVTSLALFAEISESTNDFTKKLEDSFIKLEKQNEKQTCDLLMNGICDYLTIQNFLGKLSVPNVKQAIIMESSEDRYILLDFMKNIFSGQFSIEKGASFANRNQRLIKNPLFAPFRRHIGNFINCSTENISFPKNLKLSVTTYSDAMQFCYSMMQNERVLAAVEDRVYTSPVPLSQPLANNSQGDNKENNSNTKVNGASFNFLNDSKLVKEEKEVYKSEFLPVSTFLEDKNKNKHDFKPQKPFNQPPQEEVTKSVNHQEEGNPNSSHRSNAYFARNNNPQQNDVGQNGRSNGQRGGYNEGFNIGKGFGYRQPYNNGNNNNTNQNGDLQTGFSRGNFRRSNFNENTRNTPMHIRSQNQPKVNS